MKLLDIPIAKIVVTKNVRSETEDELGGLMESIGKYDVIQPVLVLQRPKGQYELVAGHRRLAAVRARNEPTIPAIVRDDISDADIPYLKLVENVQRKDLSVVELVAAFEAMKTAHPGISMNQMAKMLGKTQTWVSDQYRALETRNELIGSGMSEEEVRRIPRTHLIHLHHVKSQPERMEVGRDLASKGAEARKARKRLDDKDVKKGPYQDRTGGFSLLTAPGSNTIRVVCDSSEIRDDVVGCLLNLKRRRVARR